MHFKIAKSLVLVFCIYLLAVLPSYSAAAVIEGAAHGLWGLSAHDWAYQGSAALVQAGSIFIFTSLFVVPLSVIAMQFAVAKPDKVRTILAVIFLVFVICNALIAGELLLIFPIAFVVASLVFVVGVFVSVGRNTGLARAT